MPEKRIAMIPVDKNATVNRTILRTLQIFVFIALTKAKAYEATSGASLTVALHTGLIPLVHTCKVCKECYCAESPLPPAARVTKLSAIIYYRD